MVSYIVPHRACTRPLGHQSSVLHEPCVSSDLRPWRSPGIVLTFHLLEPLSNPNPDWHMPRGPYYLSCGVAFLDPSSELLQHPSADAWMSLRYTRVITWDSNTLPMVDQALLFAANEYVNACWIMWTEFSGADTGKKDQTQLGIGQRKQRKVMISLYDPEVPDEVSVSSRATAHAEVLCWSSNGVHRREVSSPQQWVGAEKHLWPWNRKRILANYHFVLKCSRTRGTLSTPASFFPWLLCGQCCCNFSVQIKSVESHKKRSGP